MGLSKVLGLRRSSRRQGHHAPRSRLLTKARELGRRPSQCVYGGSDADAIAVDARHLRRHQGAHHRRPRRFGLAGRRPSPRRLAAAGRSGQRPGRPSCSARATGRARRRRSPVGQDRRARHHQRGRRRGHGRQDRRYRARLRRRHQRQDHVHHRQAATRARATKVVRRRVRGRCTRHRHRARSARSRCHRRGQGHEPVRRGGHRPQARRSSSRGVWRPWARGVGQLRPHRDAGQVAQGGPGSVTRHRRRRLGSVLATRSVRPARS